MPWLLSVITWLNDRGRVGLLHADIWVIVQRLRGTRRAKDGNKQDE